MFYVGTTNTIKIRGASEIALNSSKKTGVFYFMPFYTGNSIHSCIWYELLVDQKLIIRVEDLDNDEDQPKI